MNALTHRLLYTHQLLAAENTDCCTAALHGIMLSALCPGYRGGSTSGRSIPVANYLSSVQSTTPVPHCCLLPAVQSVHPAQKDNRKRGLSRLESNDGVIFISPHPLRANAAVNRVLLIDRSIHRHAAISARIHCSAAHRLRRVRL